MQFQISLEGKTGKEIPESSRFSSWKILYFALSDAEDNTSGPLNRGGIAELPLLISNSPKVPRKFLGMMDSFVLVAYASLAVSRICNDY